MHVAGALLVTHDRNMAMHDSVLVPGVCSAFPTLGLLAMDVLALGPTMCSALVNPGLGVMDDLVLDRWAVLMVPHVLVPFWSHEVTIFVPRAVRVARAGRDGFWCASVIVSMHPCTVVGLEFSSNECTGLTFL